MFTYQNHETINVEGKRIYQISDEIFYPSITTILGQTLEPEKAGVLDAWRKRVGHKEADRVSNEAATRGTNNHTMIERYLKGEDPRIGEFPPEHAAFFTSLKLELKKINKVFGQEVVLYSHVLGIAGRCDLIAEYKGEMAILDYKTSSRVKTADEIKDYWLQAAFYATAHNEMFGTEIKKLIILMPVANKIPMVWKKVIDDELLLNLAERVSKFYSNL